MKTETIINGNKIYYYMPFPNVNYISTVYTWGCKCNNTSFVIKKVYKFYLPLKETVNIIKMYSIDNLTCKDCKTPLVSFDYVVLSMMRQFFLSISNIEIIEFKSKDILNLLKTQQFNSIDFIN